MSQIRPPAMAHEKTWYAYRRLWCPLRYGLVGRTHSITSLSVGFRKLYLMPQHDRYFWQSAQHSASSQRLASCIPRDQFGEGSVRSMIRGVKICWSEKAVAWTGKITVIGIFSMTTQSALCQANYLHEWLSTFSCVHDLSIAILTNLEDHKYWVSSDYLEGRGGLARYCGTGAWKLPPASSSLLL